MITTHAWNRNTKKMQQVQPGSLHRRRDQLICPDEVLWIDMCNPTPEEEEAVFGKFFPIHALTLEDVTRLRREPNSQPHFPKVEEFPDYLFVIVNPLTAAFAAQLRGATPTPRQGQSFSQLSAVLTRTLLITHHYDPLDGVDQLKAHLQRFESHAERGPDYLFHLVLDAAVDQYAPVLDHIDDSLDALEQQVVQRPRPHLYARLLKLKREIILLRKTLIYEREVLVRLARGEFELVDERETVYYRNVYDHLVRFTELIESSREMVSDLMQSYLAATSNHLNQIVKLLTMTSTVVLPMTLIAGVYGMNFERLLPDTRNYYGFEIALGMMLATGLVSFGFFWWRKWL